MLRQPQLHNPGSRVSICTWLLLKAPPPHTRTRTYTHTPDQSHTPSLQLLWVAEVWAPGCGTSHFRWRGRMMTADSTWCDTVTKSWPHPHSPHSLIPSVRPSVHILTSSSLCLPRARSFRSNYSSSTCLDGSTFMKITTWAVPPHPPSTVCFYSASHCASLNLTYFIHFSILFWGVQVMLLSQMTHLKGSTAHPVYYFAAGHCLFFYFYVLFLFLFRLYVAWDGISCM